MDRFLFKQFMLNNCISFVFAIALNGLGVYRIYENRWNGLFVIPALLLLLFFFYKELVFTIKATLELKDFRKKLLNFSIMSVILFEISILVSIFYFFKIISIYGMVTFAQIFSIVLFILFIFYVISINCYKFLDPIMKRCGNFFIVSNKR